MKCLQKKNIYIYSIKIILYFLHPCTNTQGGTGLLIALRKGTDQPFKVIGHLLSLITGLEKSTPHHLRLPQAAGQVKFWMIPNVN